MQLTVSISYSIDFFTKYCVTVIQYLVKNLQEGSGRMQYSTGSFCLHSHDRYFFCQVAREDWNWIDWKCLLWQFDWRRNYLHDITSQRQLVNYRLCSNMRNCHSPKVNPINSCKRAPSRQTTSRGHCHVYPFPSWTRPVSVILQHKRPC